MWLHLPPDCLPSTSSPYAPASEDSNSACNSPTIIADRLSEASVTWRGKQEPPQAWSRRWKRGGFITRLSGLTLEPSTAQLGVDAWISSLRATRARATALPESAAANSTTDGCLIAPSTSSTPAGLILSSARTCRGTPTDSLPSQSRLWSDWAAALRSEYSARPKPEIPCGGSDCSSWPSATVMDANGARNATSGRSNPDSHHHSGTTMNDAVRQWAAPQARDHFPAHTDVYIAAKKAQGHGMRNLNDEAAMWDSPGVATTQGSRLTRSGDRNDELLLNGQALAVASICHPPSSPDHPTIAAGSTSSTDSPNSNHPSVKRKLNPIFVEALMRWPTGLSGFERQEMAWTRWWQLMPTFLSMLVSPQIEAEQQLELL